MQRIGIISVIVLTLVICCHCHGRGGAHADRTPAVSMVDDFYRSYLNAKGDRRSLHPPFSRSFSDLLKRNAELCRELRMTDICGWGANGDVYLDAQEYDPKLNYDNSRFEISEPANGLVRVGLNVYPGLSEAGDLYDRVVRFRVVQENGRWVVDDIIPSGSSAREEILLEYPALWKEAIDRVIKNGDREAMMAIFKMQRTTDGESATDYGADIQEIFTKAPDIYIRSANEHYKGDLSCPVWILVNEASELRYEQIRDILRSQKVNIKDPTVKKFMERVKKQTAAIEQELEEGYRSCQM